MSKRCSLWTFVIAIGFAGIARSQPHLDRSAATLRRLTFDGYYKTRPIWMPDSKRLAFSKHVGRAIDIVVFNLETKSGRPLVAPAPQKLRFDPALAPDAMTWAMSQCSVASNQGDVDVFLADADGSKPRLLLGNEKKLSHEEWPAWSPDGKRVACSSTVYGNQEIVVVDADGKNRRRLTEHPGIDAHPCWSPDGKQITFATDRWGALEIASVNPDGGNLKRLTKSPGLDDYPTWSPDGTKLAFVSNRDGNLEIYTANADGSKPVNRTRSPTTQDSFPCWSRDGRRICFVRGAHQRFDLFELSIE